MTGLIASHSKAGVDKPLSRPKVKDQGKGRAGNAEWSSERLAVARVGEDLPVDSRYPTLKAITSNNAARSKFGAANE